MYSNVNTEVLSKRELRALIDAARRRVAALEKAKTWRDFIDDERVVATANAILMLAYKADVPKDGVFRLVAGALRQPVRNVALSTEELKTVGATDDSTPPAAGEGSEPVATAPEASAQDTMTTISEPRRSLEDPSQPSGRRSSRVSRPRAETTDSVRTYRRRAAAAAHNDKSREEPHKGRPLYVHPANKDQYWDGQGEMPKWLRDAIAFGRSLEEFRV